LIGKVDSVITLELVVRMLVIIIQFIMDLIMVVLHHRVYSFYGSLKQYVLSYYCCCSQDVSASE
jgi:hypothetical protein